jgi:hypothetical protein
VTVRVDDLRRELARLTRDYADGKTTLPSLTEREILRVSRALARENAVLQALLANENTERMF